MKIKTKLIQTKDYLLLIDEEAEIKESKTFITKDNIIHSNYGYNYGDRVVIAYYPLTDEAKELDLPVLPSFKEINVEELAEQHLQKWRGLNNVHLSNRIQADRCKNDFVAGYEAAQQSNKQFSLDDIKKAFIAGLEFIPVDPNRYEEDADNYIQSLSTQQLPSEFIPEYENVDIGELVDMNGNYNGENVKQLKTITNSEGKEELVGTYK